MLFEAQGRVGRQKAVDLEDMKFHQCVRLARFENDRTISFIPPDGAFDLMWVCLENDQTPKHCSGLQGGIPVTDFEQRCVSQYVEWGPIGCTLPFWSN